MDFLDSLITHLDQSLKDDCDSNITFGNIIQDGYDQEVDDLRSILSEWSQWIDEYMQRLSEELWVKNVKIKYTGNMWYFIELPKNFTDIPECMIHKQSLQNVSRYTTLELQKYEQKLQSAENDLQEREYVLFQEIRENVILEYNNIHDLWKNIAYFDFLSSWAFLSLKQSWSTPEISQKTLLDIRWGRHPVLTLSMDDFISNDLAMDSHKRVHIITGPNMGWKSTFLRQNALLILLAHIWYDIPAISAKIPLTDAIFSRVGAGDNLYMGQSTFMVEMQEVSYILHKATKKSFIIIDEVGRGTSTYDGLSLAWAILHYIHNEIKSKLLFATHYHEIIDHSEKLSACENFSVAVWENSENLVFLRKIIPGGMKKSYGIEVAKIAGIPDEVLQEAQSTLKEYYAQNTQQQIAFSTEETTLNSQQTNSNTHPTLTKIQELSLDHMTPFWALELLHEFKEQLKNQE